MNEGFCILEFPSAERPLQGSIFILCFFLIRRFYKWKRKKERKKEKKIKVSFSKASLKKEAMYLPTTVRLMRKIMRENRKGVYHSFLFFVCGCRALTLSYFHFLLHVHNRCEYRTHAVFARSFKFKFATCKINF